MFLLGLAIGLIVGASMVGAILFADHVDKAHDDE